MAKATPKIEGRLMYRPYGQKVIVSRIEEQDAQRVKLASDVELYRPATSVEESRFARVESVGLGLKHPEAVAVGTEIVVAKLAGEPWVAPDGTKYVIIHEEDILLVHEQE